MSGHKIYKESNYIGWDTLEIKKIGEHFYAVQKEIAVIKQYSKYGKGGNSLTTIPTGEIRLKKVDLEVDS